MYVMRTIQMTPATVDHNVLVARPAAECQPRSPTNVNEYDPAICARLAITMTSEAMMPQPPSQPTTGPKARAAQVNVVPQSGSALFSSWYATAIRYIGTNEMSMIAGAFTPASS